MSEHQQPRIELAYGAPLQLREDGDEKVVEIRNGRGEKIELKRFERTSR